MRQLFLLCGCLCCIIGAAWIISAVVNRGQVDKDNSSVLRLCVAWAALSVGMQVLNKALVTELQAPAIVTAVQMWIAVVVVGVLCFRQFWEVERPQLAIWMIVPVFYAAMLLSSFYSYEYISLSLYTVIRNLTPLMVLPMERAIMPSNQRPRISNLVIISMFLTLAGAVMYGDGVCGISGIGVLFAILNTVLAIIDRLIQRRLLTVECKGLPSGVCTIVNNALGSLPALALAGMTPELTSAMAPENTAVWTDPYVVSLLVLSGGAGIGICYLGIETQRVVSATSFLMLQNFSKVAVVASSIALFHDPVTFPMATWGLACSLGGGALYGLAQQILQERHQQRLKKASFQDYE